MDTWPSALSLRSTPSGCLKEDLWNVSARLELPCCKHENFSAGKLQDSGMYRAAAGNYTLFDGNQSSNGSRFGFVQSPSIPMSCIQRPQIDESHDYGRSSVGELEWNAMVVIYRLQRASTWPREKDEVVHPEYRFLHLHMHMHLRCHCIRK